MQLQARAQIGGRPRSRSGNDATHVSWLHFAREDARVGATPEHVEKPVYSAQPIVEEKLTYIGVRLVDQHDKPIKFVEIRVKLPDGDIKRTTTNSLGEVMYKDLAKGGMADVTLFPAKADQPEKEAEAPPPPPPPPDKDAPLVDREFKVYVVDEAGKPIPAVMEVLFQHDRTEKRVSTDTSGLAVYKAATDSV